MDLGIAGRKAIVCASSRGLGRACAHRLAEAGCEVVVNGRDKARTESTASEIAKASGARAGLTAFLAGVSRSVAQHNVTINFLLPGPFDTDRLRSNHEITAKKQGITVEEALKHRMATIPAKRLGQADEFGAACAFLCSTHAGFITGQNLLMDGGIFPGAF